MPNFIEDLVDIQEIFWEIGLSFQKVGVFVCEYLYQFSCRMLRLDSQFSLWDEFTIF